MTSPDEQIQAILGGNTFRWATDLLQESTSIDDVRFRDLIQVSADDVDEYVRANGFPAGVVMEGAASRWADDRLHVVPEPDGRWAVYYAERGKEYDRVVVPTQADARREVISRLMVSARIMLNARYRLAHPDEALPLPGEMD